MRAAPSAQWDYEDLQRAVDAAGIALSRSCDQLFEIWIAVVGDRRTRGVRRDHRRRCLPHLDRTGRAGCGRQRQPAGVRQHDTARTGEDDLGGSICYDWTSSGAVVSLRVLCLSGANLFASLCRRKRFCQPKATAYSLDVMDFWILRVSALCYSRWSTTPKLRFFSMRPARSATSKYSTTRVMLSRMIS